MQQHDQRTREFEEITDKRNECRQWHDNVRKNRLNEFMSGFSIITDKLKEMYQMITLGGNAELELVDTLDPFTEGIVFRYSHFRIYFNCYYLGLITVYKCKTTNHNGPLTADIFILVNIFITVYSVIIFYVIKILAFRCWLLIVVNFSAWRNQCYDWNQQSRIWLKFAFSKIILMSNLGWLYFKITVLHWYNNCKSC